VPPPRGTCHVVYASGADQLELSKEAAQWLLASGSFFWLDLHEPKPDDFDVLRSVFRFHPLALEDSEHFGQRAKMRYA
jgi:magnesium transporter